MSRRRHSLAALLAEAKIADRDIEMARARAARDSGNFKNATQALTSLVPAAASLYGDHVQREEGKAEKLRTEKREDDALVAKLGSAEKLAKMREEREAAKLKAEQEAAAAERAEKARLAEIARADAMDREAAEFNLKSFAQEDSRKAHADKLALEREKMKKRGGGGGPSTKATKDALDIEAKKLDIEAKKRTAEKDASAPEEKKRAQIVEVENFVANINDNIDALIKQIDETGTFEAFGPESADMERAITAIATDLAKLADPGSVAREGEVDLAKRGLFPTGAKALFTSNDTAKQTLQHLKAEVERRRANAYRVRGLSDGAAPAPAASGADPFADLR